MTGLSSRFRGFRSSGLRLLLVGGGLLLFTVVGAYFDWQLWADEGGIVVTLVAVPLAVVGTVVALIGRGMVRRVAVAVLIAGVGLLAGQLLGPSREILTFQEGTMTIHLTSPVVATAAGSAYCRNVASATEFEVDGDANMQLDTPDRPFLTASIDKGDRWEARVASPRKNGVRLDLWMTGRLVSDAGKPSTTSMVAGPSSTVESVFTNAGGSLRFADLIPETGPGTTGESVAFAGTIEWTCADVPR